MPYLGEIRIIGGSMRGRQLNVLNNVEGLRPTTNRIRETLFNWLAFDINNSAVLDAFCGSGALALEALSRGANSVYALDINYQVIQNLNYNLTKLNCNKVTTYHKNTIEFLTQNAICKFDVVFLDPPFNSNLLELSCNLLEANKWLNSCAVIYCEDNKPLLNLNNWQLYRHKRAGNVYYGLFKRVENKYHV